MFNKEINSLRKFYRAYKGKTIYCEHPTYGIISLQIKYLSRRDGYMRCLIVYGSDERYETFFNLWADDLKFYKVLENINEETFNKMIDEKISSYHESFKKADIIGKIVRRLHYDNDRNVTDFTADTIIRKMTINGKDYLEISSFNKEKRIWEDSKIVTWKQYKDILDSNSIEYVEPEFKDTFIEI